MTEQLRAWWGGLDNLGKAVRAAILFCVIGAGVGTFVIRTDVVANTDAIEALAPRVQMNTDTLRVIGPKLERLICYAEEQAREANGEHPNFARCTR